MRCIAIVLAALSLASCLKPPSEMVLARCGSDANKLYASAPDRSIRVSQYRMDCMASHGFEWRTDDRHCLDILGHDWATSHGECYRRTRKAS